MRNRHATTSFPALATLMPVEVAARVDDASTFGSGDAPCDPLHAVRSVTAVSATHVPVPTRLKAPRTRGMKPVRAGAWPSHQGLNTLFVVAARTDPVRDLSADLASVISGWCRLLAQEGVHVNRTWLSVLSTLTTGPRRLGDLAASEFVSQPGMTMLVSRLEGEGWVERRPDTADGRVVNVAITPAGRRMLRSAIEARNQALRRRIEHLGPEELQELEHAVTTLERLRCDATSNC